MRLINAIRASRITITKSPQEPDRLYKDLQNILIQIQDNDIQYGEDGFFPCSHEIASETDEIKFGIYILAAATQGKIPLVPLNYLRRAVFRVLQLLNNPDKDFFGKEEMRNWVEDAYNLLKTDEMPESKMVDYNETYDNLLFYIRQNPEYYLFQKELGLSTYYVKSSLKIYQKILHRLTYYLHNFNYPAECVEAFKNIFSYTNNKNVRVDIVKTALTFESKLDPDSFIQLWILCHVVLTDSEPGIHKEALSCLYWYEEYRDILISLAAKLPASIVLRQVEVYLERVKNEGISSGYLHRAFGKCENFFRKNPVPKVKLQAKSSEEQHIAILSKALIETKEEKLVQIGEKIQHALEHSNFALALLHVSTLEHQEKKSLNKMMAFDLAFSDIRKKFFDQTGSGILLKKAFLPKGLNTNLSIEPIILIGGMQECGFIASCFSGELSKQNQIDPSLIHPEEKSDNTLSYNIHYDGKIENLLDIIYQQKPGELGSVSIRLSFHCLSKDQISTVLTALIATLNSFFEHVNDEWLSNIKNLRMLKLMDDTTHSSASLLKGGFTFPKTLAENLEVTHNQIVEFKKEEDNRKDQRHWALELVQIAINELSAILEFHQHADLTLWHSEEPELATATASNPLSLFGSPKNSRTAGDIQELESQLIEHSKSENSIN